MRTPFGAIAGAAFGVWVAAATTAANPALVVVGFATVGAYAALLVRPSVFGRLSLQDVRVMQLLAAVNVGLLLIVWLGSVPGLLGAGALLILGVARKRLARRRAR